MATTDIYTVQGSLCPCREAIRFRGGATDEGIQIDTLAAALVAGNHTKGTITAWIMCPDNTGTYTYIGFGDASAVEYVVCNLAAGKIQLKIVDTAVGTLLDVITTNQVITPNQWHHVAIVQNAGTPVIYVDGVKKAITLTTDTSLGQWFADLDVIDGAHIGTADSIAGDAALTQEFKGYISDVKVWSGTADTAALTEAQIKEDINGVPNTTSLLAHYDMKREVVNQANPGTYNGTLTATAVYSDACEFACKLTFNPTFTIVSADYRNLSISGKIGFAILTDAA